MVKVHMAEPVNELDEAHSQARTAAKRAKQAAAACVLLLGVAVAILAIDNGIKRDILTAAKQARQLLDEFGALVENHTVTVHPEVVTDGPETAPGEAGASAGGPDAGANGVAHAAGTSKATAGHAGSSNRAGPGRKARTGAGARGDGGRARRAPAGTTALPDGVPAGPDA